MTQKRNSTAEGLISRLYLDSTALVEVNIEVNMSLTAYRLKGVIETAATLLESFSGASGTKNKYQVTGGKET